MNRQQIKKWIFIGGAPRSGTSLLQAIFNQHSQCSSPPESHLLETFEYAARLRAKEALKDRKLLVEVLKEDKWVHRLKIDPAVIAEKLPANATGIELFRLYMEEYVAPAGKSILVEGAPLNLWFLKKLHADFPGCYILHIVRDPRDVILSTEKADYNKSFDFPVMEIALQFMESYLQGPKFGPRLYGDHYIKMYYEDLITKPEETLRFICSRLNIDFEPAMLDFHESSQKVASQEEKWKVNLSKPFLKNNFGKWKTEMNVGDVIRTEYICREFFEMEKDHYQTSDTPFITARRHLSPLYIKQIKSYIRKMISSGVSPEGVDLLPPHDRMRAAGLLEV